MLSFATFTSLWAMVAAVAIVPEVQKRQANSNVASNIFLRRGYQQTAVLDGWAYIDGGEFSIASNNDIDYNYSNQLIAIDLSQDWTNSTVTLTTIAKPDAPLLTDGGIWVDQDNHQLYIGFAGRRSSLGNNQVQTLGLWSFKPDGSGSGTWTNLSTTADPDFNIKPRSFSSTTASGNGVGYSLGGFFVNGSSQDASVHQILAGGLIMYDFSTKKRTNLTVTGTQLSTTNGGQMGGLVYTSNFGSKGILVAAGGAQLNVTSANDNLVDFGTVSIFDIASQKWYDQPTTGNIPEKRKEFCMTGLASTNNTYEILVYAGWGGNLGSIAIPFDEAYVLSIPAFQWFKASYPASSPHHGLSCNPVGGSQIMTCGGVDSSKNGPNNLYLDVFDSRDPFTRGLNIFDMNQLKFTNTYSAKPAAYTQAKVVANYYASNARTPTFSSGLSSVFAVQNFAATSTSSAGSSSSSGSSNGNNTSSGSNAGAIAGGVVGGIVVLLFILGAVWFFLRRRKRQQPRVGEMSAVPATGGYSDQPGTAASAANALTGYHEADGAAARHELGGYSGAVTGTGAVGSGEGAKYYPHNGKLGSSRASEMPTDHTGDGARYELQ